MKIINHIFHFNSVVFSSHRFICLLLLYFILFPCVTLAAAPTVSGTVAGQAVNDNATISPFSGVSFTDPDAGVFSVTVTLDDSAKGMFTTASLSSSGFSDDGGGVYSLSGTTAATATTSITTLVFDPTDNRVTSGNTETTTFTIDANNGSQTTTDNTTTVISTSINDDPVNTTPHGITGSQEAGNLLSATGVWTDPEGDTITYNYFWYQADDGVGTNAVLVSSGSGADYAGYSTSGSQKGKFIRVDIQVVSGAFNVTESSPYLEIINATPVNSEAPIVYGDNSISGTLQTTDGGWSDIDGDALTYSYQWYVADDDAGTNLSAVGSDQNSYVVQAGDAGKYIRVRVTASDGVLNVTSDSLYVLVGNSAPTLSGSSYTFASTDEDTATVGVRVSILLSSLGAADSNSDPLGMAIYASSGNGTWQFSIDSFDGSDGVWTAFGSVSQAAALLLDENSWVRYQPDGATGETANFQFLAWDQGTGTASTSGSPSTEDTTPYYSYVGEGDGAGSTNLSAYSSEQATASLIVANIPDAPVITSSASQSVEENVFNAFAVEYTDPDLNDSAAFYISGGSDQALFEINGSGLLSFISSPDFEVPSDSNSDNDYEVEVTVSDNRDLSDSRLFVVTVTDVTVSDVAPPPNEVTVDPAITVSFTISENITDVGVLENLVRGGEFSITGGVDQAKFQVDAATGELSFISAPDYETPTDSGADNIYDVEVSLSLNSVVQQVQTIDVTIQDISNTAFTITNYAAAWNAPEDVSVYENSTTVHTIVATPDDLPGTGFTFVLSDAFVPSPFAVASGDAAKFSVDTSGNITFNSAPDYEAPGDFGANNIYNISVSVTSNSGGFAQVHYLQVTVVDLTNEAYVPESLSVNAAENQTAVTTVVGSGSGVISYAITGGLDQALFSVGSGTGVVTFNSAPNFEAPSDSDTNNIYELEVTVYDDGVANAMKMISVTVTDESDAPVISSSATPSVNEGSTTVTTVVAIEEDANDGVVYSLTGGVDQALFSIGAGSGVLSFTTAPDFESPTDSGVDNIYNVQVTVEDSTRQSDVQDLTITVNNINDAPVITSNGGGISANVSMAENQTVATTVVIQDDDSSDTHSFSISGGDDASLFSIDASGVLSFNSAPDYESPGDSGANNVYEVAVTVADDGTGALEDIQALYITVSNANDAPVITSTAGTGATEDTLYTYVASVSDDDDANNGSDLLWSLSNAPTGMSVSSTGTVTWTPTEGVITSGAVTLRVADGGEDGAVAATEVFTITVTPVNDAPSLTTTAGTSATEDTLYTYVASVTDPDDANNGSDLLWSLSNAPTGMSVSSTGTVTWTPTEGVITSGAVTLRVADGGEDGTVAATEVFTITVTPVNDAPTGSVIISGSAVEDQTLTASNTLSDSDGITTIAYQWSRDGVAVSGATSNTYILSDSDVGAVMRVTASYTDNGGTNESVTSAATSAVSNVNDVPVMVNNLGLTVDEGGVGFINTAQLQVSDVDNLSSEILFTLSAVPTNGTLQITGSDLVAGSQFSQEQIDLGLLVYLHDSGETVSDNFAFDVSDSAGGVIGSTLFSITITPVNDLPVISNMAGDSHTYRITDPLLLIDSGSDASVSDADSIDFDGGNLTVNIPVNRDNSEDQLLIDTSGSVSLSSGMTAGSMVLVNNTPVGTLAVNGTGTGTDDLIVSFDQAAGNATLARVTTLVRSVAYLNSDTVAVTENNRTIRFVVNDGDGTDSNAVDVTVTVVNNRIPTATDSTIIATEDVAYTFASGDFSYNDADGDPLAQVKIISLPLLGELKLNSTAVAANDVIMAADITNLTYQAGLNENGSAYTSFGYQVHDGNRYATNSNTMTVDISPVNDEPIISGTPTTRAVEGISYSFIPTASDVDVGDTLSFVITNPPTWANFNVVTGELSGSPTANDVGVVTGIVIGVDDGTTTISLAAFDLTIVGDLDGDTLGDDVDGDIDGDGMDNQFEIDNGLDPRDATDAQADADGDGINNLNEYNAGSDLFADDYPPVVTAPDDITVDATGLFTEVALGQATAIDGLDGELIAIADVGNYFTPGVNQVTWRATDAAGNAGTAIQIVNVIPLVSFSKDQNIGENVGSVTVKAILNGEAVNYPVTVPYTISGTATAVDDYFNAPAELVISSGTEASITFNVVDDGVNGEGAETIIFDMEAPTNAVIGAKSRHVVRVVEGNVPPKVKLVATQNATQVRIVEVGSASVVVTAMVQDGNALDTHTYDWSATDNALSDTDLVDGSFTFTPSAVGLYMVQVAVSDGEATESAKMAINVIANVPTLSSGTDSDADGVDDATEGNGDSDNDGIPNPWDPAGMSGNTLPEQATISDSFIIESEPGLTLILGQVAFQAAENTPSVSADDITLYGNQGQGAGNDDNFSYPGGRFDFIVNDLPVTGQSVNVVIPQFAPIPANAVYRKLMPSGWQFFVVDSNNLVASAPGAQGYCPPPGDMAYQPGLAEGDWCVQLTIEDGGPNDADGGADGTVTDPGGVAQLSNAAVEVSGGGGAMGVSSLIILLLAGLRRRWWLLPLGLFISVPAQAWYVGGAIGSAEGDKSMAELNQQIAEQGINATASNLQDSRSGWKLWMGVPLDEVLSFEAAFVDLGEVDVQISGSTTDIQDFFDNIQGIHPSTASGLNLGFRWGVKVDASTEANLRMGVFFWDADYTLSSPYGRRGVNANGRDLSMGVGLARDITPVLKLCLDFDRYEISNEDVAMWSVGLQYRFD